MWLFSVSHNNNNNNELNLLFETLFPSLEQVTLRVIALCQFGDHLSRLVQVRYDR